MTQDVEHEILNGRYIETEETMGLATVDEKLEAALAPIVREYSEISINKEMFRKFMVPGATDAEVFFCMGKTRALGLDPLKPGEVYYIKFAGKPYDLFVGYPVYVQKCSEAGLEHWEYEFDNDDEPKVCTVTFYIKGKEKPFVMKVWFDEVAATISGGKLNSRWEKAGRFQFMKCSFVQTSRFCPGLAQVQLPYIPEEMPEPPAPGYRTLTQPQLDVYTEEDTQPTASIGTVDAAHHQADTDSIRRVYFGLCKGNKKKGILGIIPDDNERRELQKKVTGKEHAADFDLDDYSLMIEAVHGYRSDDPEPDPSSGQKPPAAEEEDHAAEIEEATEKAREELAAESSVFMDARKALSHAAAKVFVNTGSAEEWIRKEFNKEGPELNFAELSTATAKLYEVIREDGQEGEQKAQDGSKGSPGQPGKDGPDAEFLTSKETKAKLRAILLEFPGFPYSKGIGTVKFLKKASEILEEEITDIDLTLDSDALLILDALKTELAELTGEITENSIDLDDESLEDDDTDYLDLYLTKAAGIFTDNKKRRSWERHNDLPDKMIAKWPKEALMRGYALLEGVTTLDAKDEKTEPEEPEAITQEQIDDMGLLIHGMPERFHASIGSVAFRELCTDITKGKWEGITFLAERHASDIILEMKDAVQDEIQAQRKKAEADDKLKG